MELIEQRFGKRIGTGILLLVALAIVAVCIGVIWNYLLSPVSSWVRILAERGSIPRPLATALNILLLAFVGFVAVYAGGEVSNRIQHYRMVRLFDKDLEERRQIADRMRRIKEALEDIKSEKILRSDDFEKRLQVIEERLGITAQLSGSGEHKEG